MNVLFLTLVKITTLDERGIYTDLLRKFREKGHVVFVVSPSERRDNKKTRLSKKEGVSILSVRTLNLQKTNVLEKGIGTLAIEYQYLNAIKQHFEGVKFDLILYSTPPITFSKVIDFVKKRDNAYSYLLLKDIFPQNAVDMKMIKKNSFLHRMFIKKEKKLYQLSDTIGCMSQANVDFILNHNSELCQLKVEINPNSIEPLEINYSDDKKIEIRKKYQIPLDKKILVYGGNLGKPQGIYFLLKTIEECTNEKAFFLIIGDGTEFNKIQNWFKGYSPTNAKLVQSLPKEDFDVLLAACDIGLIFLHPDFLIPNFPSRLLSYLEMKKPIIAATDTNTDIGNVIENANCGYKVIAGDIEKMNNVIHQLIEKDNLDGLGMNAWDLLQRNYLVANSYQLIVDKVDQHLNSTINLA
ncbi:glycosyltransferase family 4 protein [Flavobacterium sp. GT3P67]|uniref:glycosyltransferase family 4 protein n=1 Tax=Flavobacterium sp. GT3P67 TaxID=2541722 RepID=UPI00105030BE|nr:glycosyltransferase family 4 protein [Flavobacterium sp. GT3P67]TDE51289.1 glycosyltransferase WbuB [Flavobacterium sp. GT3P67]